jgi:hypothetical protein
MFKKRTYQHQHWAKAWVEVWKAYVMNVQSFRKYLSRLKSTMSKQKVVMFHFTKKNKPETEKRSEEERAASATADDCRVAPEQVGERN